MNDVIRTSDRDWLAKAIKCYTEKKAFTLEDDAGLGLTKVDLESAVSLIRAAKSKAGVGWLQVSRVLASLGITGVGLWMVWAAVVDPEPTSKLGLLIAGGTVLALTGSLGLLAALGLRFSVTAKSPQGHSFEVTPE